MAAPTPWTSEHAAEVYRLLEHPADLWIEVRGADFSALCAHALIAFYDNLVDTGTVQTAQARHVTVEEATPAEALRALMAEALYLFDAEGFVGAAVQVDAEEPRPGERVPVEAVVWGELLDLTRHDPLGEIKAITYHQLRAEPDPGGGWVATVLLDV